eukprot:5945069-Amphidinium_carterae.1
MRYSLSCFATTSAQVLCALAVHALCWNLSSRLEAAECACKSGVSMHASYTLIASRSGRTRTTSLCVRGEGGASHQLTCQNCTLKIADFGLARSVTAPVRCGIATVNEIEKTEYVVTRWYRAPELVYPPEQICGCCITVQRMVLRLSMSKNS